MIDAGIGSRAASRARQYAKPATAGRPTLATTAMAAAIACTW
jgi:hypothetical protein